MAITGELPRGRRRLVVSDPEPARRPVSNTSPPPPWAVDQPAPRPEERAAQRAITEANRRANQLAAEEAVRRARQPVARPIEVVEDDEDWFDEAPRRRMPTRTARRLAVAGALLLVVGGGTALAGSQGGAAAAVNPGVSDHATSVLDPFQRAAEAGPAAQPPAPNGPALLGRSTP